MPWPASCRPPTTPDRHRRPPSSDQQPKGATISFARTVLGDIAPEELGTVYAHEHLVIHGGRPVQLFPDFALADVDKAVAGLAPCQEPGLRTVVAAMPADRGRDVLMLAEIARLSGVNVIAPSGLHHERYYHDRHWSVCPSFSGLMRERGLSDAELRTLFVDAPGGAYTFGTAHA